MYVFERGQDTARVFIAALPYRDASLSPHAVSFSLRSQKEIKLEVCIQHQVYTHQLYLLQKHVTGRANGYKKRVHHDQLVPKGQFQDKYILLKERHEHWMEEWSEKTDPKKYVIEDISIAAYLICLWENEAQHGKQSFVDIGCGNGLLTHILTAEGYNGFGVDLAKRKIWDAFIKQGTDLREEAVDVKTASYPEVDWIISNHGDEVYPFFMEQLVQRLKDKKKS